MALPWAQSPGSSTQRRETHRFVSLNPLLIYLIFVEPGDLDLNLLFTLDALLQEESITRAAARLGRSAPAVSQALAKLREALDDPLLVRAGRGMVPSPRAEQLREPVASVLERIAAVFEPGATFAPQASKRTFRIHGSDYVVHVLGAELDARLRAAAPEVSLRVMPNADDAQRVRDGSLDLAIGVYPDLPPEVRIQKLFDETLVCVVRDRHPSVPKRLTPERFAALQHVQIAPGGRAGGVVDDALAKQGLHRAVVRQVPFFYAGLVLVSRTDLALTLPRRLACAEAKRYGLRVLALPVDVAAYPVSQIWHPRHDADAGHRWFRRMVVDAARATKPKRATAPRGVRG